MDLERKIVQFEVAERPDYTKLQDYLLVKLTHEQALHLASQLTRWVAAGVPADFAFYGKIKRA